MLSVTPIGMLTNHFSCLFDRAKHVVVTVLRFFVGSYLKAYVYFCVTVFLGSDLEANQQFWIPSPMGFPYTFNKYSNWATLMSLEDSTGVVGKGKRWREAGRKEKIYEDHYAH